MRKILVKIVVTKVRCEMFLLGLSFQFARYVLMKQLSWINRLQGHSLPSVEADHINLTVLWLKGFMNI